jgi:hypothetical protein
MWCGFINNRVIDPFFIEHTVTSTSYADMLENVIAPWMVGDLQPTIIFKKNGAPIHWTLFTLENS